MGSRLVRRYGPTRTPLSRVLGCAQVSAKTKARLRAHQQRLNPFALRREVERQLRENDARRLLPRT